MINDLIELEPLLSQYDAGKVFVGPLLSLSISSSFRYFYIAGNGTKVYESIGLGFEAETDAESQRVNVMEKLKSRFREVMTPDSHLEMAEAVHTLWPNEETASVLALAALEAKAHPTNVAGQDDTVHDDGQGCALGGGSGPELTNVVAGESLTHIKDIASVLTSHDPGQPLPVFHAPAIPTPPKLPEATASWPLNEDHTATQQERSSGLNQDNIAAAVLELKSSMGSVPAPPIEATRSPASSRFRFYVGGSIAALLVGIIVLSSALRVADKATPSAVRAPLISSNVADDSPLPSEIPSGSASSRDPKVDEKVPQSEQQALVMPPSSPLQSPQLAGAAVATESISSGPIGRAELPQAEPTRVTTPPPPSQSAQTASAKTDEPTPQAEPEPVAPPSPTPQMSNAQPETAPVSRSQPPPATRLNGDVIATFVSRAEVFLKSGDFAAARVLLRRAADAGSASATLMLGGTFDPVVIDELGAVGVQPDIAQARQWYEKAVELGSDVAAQRLARLALSGSAR
jgi:hypothetical protein